VIVQYRVTVRDWAAFSFYHMSHSPLIWVMRALLLLFVLKGEVSAIHPGDSVGRYVFAVGFMAVVFSAMTCATTIIDQRGSYAADRVFPDFKGGDAVLVSADSEGRV